MTGRTARAAAALIGTVGLILGFATPAAATPASLQHQEWWIGRLGLQQSWKITKGAAVTVAVVGSGVDATVPDLHGAMVPGFTVGAGSGAQIKITNPDVAQDARGIDTSAAVDIAGRGTGPGILGVAPEAKILPVLLFGTPGHEDWAAALDKLSALPDPPQVAYLSIAYDFHEEGCPSDVQQAVQRAVAKGIILVAGAGTSADSGSIYPPNCKGVVAVGAFDFDGKPSSLTPRQPYVSLGGPGVDIVGYNRARHTFSTPYSNTDAAALVAGEFALVRAHFPSQSSRQIVARMFATASQKLYPGPRYGHAGDTLGYGPAVVQRALTENVPANAPNAVYDDLAKLGPVSSPSSGAVSGSATSDAQSTHGNVTESFPNSSKGGSSGSNTGLIVGIVVAAVVVLLVGGFLLTRRRGRHNAPPGTP